jgi:hypothetical protein
VRHRLAQLAQRCSGRAPGSDDLMPNAAGDRFLAPAWRGGARELVTIRREGDRLDVRRADVEPDQEIAGLGHRRSIARAFVSTTIPSLACRPVNGF